MNRPYDQDLDTAFNSYVEARDAAHNEQGHPLPAQLVCGIEWAARCIVWATIAGAVSMLLANVAAF